MAAAPYVNLQQLKNVICYAKYEYAFRNKPSSVAILHMILCADMLFLPAYPQLPVFTSYCAFSRHICMQIKTLKR
ncbi:hypothetical protein T06_10094 [Trichinella sp. T6]|nr:hypothetical protein T06_1754 [Trichinella sp. T6]KRX69797.1 hypothetical protein T06_10094 [Trichinella sp. T6]